MEERHDDNRFDEGAPEGGGYGRVPRRGLFLQFAMLLAAVLVLVLVLDAFHGGKTKPTEVSVKEFEQLIAQPGTVVKISGDGREVVAELGGPGGREIKFKSTPGYVDDHVDAWRETLENREGDDKAGTIVWKSPPSPIWMILIQTLPFLIIVLIVFYFIRRQAQAAGSRDSWSPFIGSSTSKARKERPDVTFEDVAGIEDAKEEVQELVEFLRNPEKFRKIGGRIPRGVLLVGAPGTGKTLLAKAIAGEAEAPFFSLCGSDFVELFVGVGAARVRDLFVKARQSQPAIIFLDEIDAVGRKRGTGLGGGHDEREQTLNAILSEMDGFSRDTGVIVIAATNRPDVLDPALLRPGRFDREIVVDMPDLNGRRKILEVHLREVKSARDIDLDQIARGTPGFTGADIEALVNEAAIRAAIAGQSFVTTLDLEEARDKVRFGRRRKNSRIMSDEDRRMTAFHEAGHALIAQVEEDVEPLHKVTIIPRGVSLGMTMVLPEQDKHGLRRRECLGQIRMNLAGRIAEQMFCNDISTGAENDIRGATEIARRMVTQWGMSERLGPIRYSDEEQHVFLGNEITQAKRHSDSMAAEIDAEIGHIINECYEQARQTLEANRARLEAIARALLDVETLSGDEVRQLMEGTPLESIKEERKQSAILEEQKQQEAADAEPEEHLGGPASGHDPRPAPA